MITPCTKNDANNIKNFFCSFYEYGPEHSVLLALQTAILVYPCGFDYFSPLKLKSV